MKALLILVVLVVAAVVTLAVISGHSDLTITPAVTSIGSTTPVTVYSEGSTLCTAYQGCDQGVEVEFCAVTGMPHCWPDNCYLDPRNMMFQAFKASPPMWQFFSQYSLP